MRARSAAAALAALGAAAALRRRRRRRDAVELHYGDGSMVALEAGTPAGDRLLALARAVGAMSR
jgi:hypothetical protein